MKSFQSNSQYLEEEPRQKLEIDFILQKKHSQQKKSHTQTYSRSTFSKIRTKRDILMKNMISLDIQSILYLLNEKIFYYAIFKLVNQLLIINLFVMSIKLQNLGVKIEEPSEEKKSNKYSHISYTLRRELIKEVEKNGLSIYRAAKDLGIKNCTAKAILRQYRQSGHIFKRKNEKKRRNKKVIHEDKILREEVTPKEEEQPMEEVPKKVEQNTWSDPQPVVEKINPSPPIYYPFLQPNLLTLYYWQ